MTLNGDQFGGDNLSSYRMSRGLFNGRASNDRGWGTGRAMDDWGQGTGRAVEGDATSDWANQPVMHLGFKFLGQG